MKPFLASPAAICCVGARIVRSRGASHRPPVHLWLAACLRVFTAHRQAASLGTVAGHLRGLPDPELILWTHAPNHRRRPGAALSSRIWEIDEARKSRGLSNGQSINAPHMGTPSLDIKPSS